MSRLKPCPFCGGKARVLKAPCGEFRDFFIVGCFDDDLCFGNINHMTMIFVTQERAEETWNRRTPDERK